MSCLCSCFCPSFHCASVPLSLCLLPWPAFFFRFVFVFFAAFHLLLLLFLLLLSQRRLQMSLRHSNWHFKLGKIWPRNQSAGVRTAERRVQTRETADCRLQTTDGRLLGGNRLRDVRFSLGKLFASAAATAYDALRVRLGLRFCKSNCPTQSFACVWLPQLFFLLLSLFSHCCCCCCCTIHRFHGHCCSCKNAARNSMWQCVVIRLMICLSG